MTAVCEKDAPVVLFRAVVGFPHAIKGSAIHAYVTLVEGVQGNDTLKAEVSSLISTSVGRFAVPDIFQFAPALPKTRSGKIMRRILKKIADPVQLTALHRGDLTSLGDTSTLAEPVVVNDLIQQAHADRNSARGKL
eukprot:SAG31_NODE_10_length_40133_cov_27.863041_8_plen_136_part_00